MNAIKFQTSYAKSFFNKLSTPIGSVFEKEKNILTCHGQHPDMEVQVKINPLRNRP